jgi:hypothetical protein
MAVAPKRVSLQKEVYEFLRKSPGIPFHMSDIGIGIGQPDRLSTIQSALSRMTENKEYPIYRVGKGTYVFRPNAVNATDPYVREVTPVREVKQHDIPTLAEMQMRIDASKKAEDKAKGRVYEYVGKVGNTGVLIRDDNAEMYVAYLLADILNSVD